MTPKGPSVTCDKKDNYMYVYYKTHHFLAVCLYSGCIFRGTEAQDDDEQVEGTESF